MERGLRERRDRAANRHDAALTRFPDRRGQAFRDQLEAVVSELTAVAAAAEDGQSDPVELAKTYRWIGDACFDLGQGQGDRELSRGLAAYQRADELMAGAEAPVEKAKLDFSEGNTLRGLSGGFDVGLLEASQVRYQQAAHAFRAHHLPDLASTVELQLRVLEPQLRLARKRAELEKGQQRLAELASETPGAGVAAREQLALELQGIRKAAGRGDVDGALREALEAIKEQHGSHPAQSGDAGERMSSLEAHMGALSKSLHEIAPRGSPPPGDRVEEGLLRALGDRLERDASSGLVSPERADRLRSLLSQFGEALRGGGDMVSLGKLIHRLHDLMKQAMDLRPAGDQARSPRASRTTRILDELKRHLQAEKAGMFLQPSEESGQATELLRRLLSLEERLRGSRDDAVVAEVEGEAWRLALAVQEHARRYHITVAAPIFATAAVHADPRSLFVSGSVELEAVASALAGQDGIQLFARALHGDVAAERWNQLCAASAALFDLGVPAGAPRAQVCYELGLALALGKPSVVAVRSGERPPFDVPLQATEIQGDGVADEERVRSALVLALGSIAWGGAEAGLGDGPDLALVRLEQRFGRRLSEGSLGVALDLARMARGDAVAFRRTLQDLLGMLGGDAPTLLWPAWRPAYPAPGARPRLFHVMPFRPEWSRAIRNLAEAACRQAGWDYSRGDEAEEQQVLRGIWSEIGRASAVLVDLTGFNPNVALELGVAHALGRHYRLVAQGDPEAATFGSLEKIQVHGYGHGPAFTGFTEVVAALLGS